MGVLVVYIHWEIESFYSKDVNDCSFHQFFYIETTEVGIEAYRSLYGNDATQLMEIEQAMIGGLGASKVNITEREVCLLVQEYASYNERFGGDLPEGKDEFSFILRKNVMASQAEKESLLLKTCEKLDNVNQLINYFLMRYFAGDMDAVYPLCTPKLHALLPDSSDIDTLCMNTIESRSDADGEPYYLCESLLESDIGHKIVTSEVRITLEKIDVLKLISVFRISDAETAMKLERPEFITVYEILSGPAEVSESLDRKYKAAMKRDTDCGRLYLNFHENNNHLKEPVYRLNDDVNGMIYVSVDEQLVLATYSLAHIHRLEREIESSPIGKSLRSLSKYEFKEDIFYDFVHSDTGDFVQFVEYLCEFDDDE
jgi:hypothetical protein